MSKKFVLVSFTLAALLSGYYVYAVFVKDEMKSKSEWATLQIVESEYREKPLNEHLILLQRQDRYLVGIASANNRNRVWVLLTPEHEPRIKQLPDGDYRLSLSELKQIASSCKVDSMVLRELLSHTF